MVKNIIGAGLILAAFSTAAYADGFYVALDAKSHKCSVMDKAPDGKTMTDAGTKVYANKANAEQALSALKACNEPAAMMAPAPKAAAPAAPAAMAPAAKVAAPAAPAAATPAAAVGFYVAQDAKTKKCMVSDKAPDGKTMMDVGTKVYENQANAEKAAAMLKVCGEASMAPAAGSAGFYVAQDAKTKKCMVSDKAPDGKAMMDVGTKVYANQANAEQAVAMLKVCQ